MNRREFAALLGLGGAATALSLRQLSSAFAAPPSGPVRFLAIRTPHGVDRDYWIPRNSDGSEPREVEEDLSGLTFDYEDAVLTPLMPWRDRITVIDGLDTQCTKEGTRGNVRTAHGHAEQGTLLTGAQPPSDRNGFYDGHPSLDFYLHAQLQAPVLLTASVEGTGTWKCMSYDDAGRPRDPTSNPQELFRQAFPTDFMPPDPMVEAPDFRPGERAINGYAEARLQRMMSRLTGTERQKLATHLQVIQNLDPGDGPMPMLNASCGVTGMDVPEESGRVRTWDRVETVTRAQARVIGQAFACGRSMCATLQILNDYPNYYTDVPAVRESGVIGRYGDSMRFHENLVHDYWGANGEDAVLRRGYCAGLNWATGHFVAVLEELDRIPDPLDPSGGSMLENTVIFWHNEFGHDGHDRQHTRHPTIIAGGGGRTLKLGKYLRLRDIDSEQRIPHNKLLTSLCHAVGVTSVDYFGDRDLRERAEYRGPLEALMV